MLQVVWFKRDLRIHDHVPLATAASRGSLLCLYIVETAYWQLPDTSERQWAFVRESVEDLQQQVACLGGQMLVVAGEATEVMQQLRNRWGRFDLHSHEETGNHWTFQRDRAVRAWCEAQGQEWHEYPQFGVRRASKEKGRHSRDDWAKYWHHYVHTPLTNVPTGIEWANTRMPLASSLPITEEGWPKNIAQDPRPCFYRQAGGRRRALAVLNSFMTLRGEHYRGSISSPLTAESACSRLSTYLAYGCVSLKEVFERLTLAQAQAPSLYWENSLAAFESRLWWHCHFIQKLEDQPDIEWRNLHPAMASLQRVMETAYFEAWQNGRTGWPMVDACMRYLHCHGWINFRMRAMLVSIACYPLWLPWQPVALWLARLFTDYEPGIHYPQIQMQAGTTGINIPRIYNPTLQAQRLDPTGKFIRRWVPELDNVSRHWIHEPWKMGSRQQAHFGLVIGKDYPAPLVDYQHAARVAKQRLTDIRDHNFVQTSKVIGERHGSRKRSQTGRTKTTSRRKNVDESQLDLFE